MPSKPKEFSNKQHFAKVFINKQQFAPYIFKAERVYQQATVRSLCPQSRKSLLTNDDDVELNVLGCRVDMLGTNCDQCVCMVQ